MNKIQTISDLQLGEIVFQKNVKAKKFIIRFQNGKIKVTIPLYGNITEAKEFLFENRQKLLQKIQLGLASLSPQIDETELRRKAQSILPDLLSKLAGLHGFTYSDVKIRKSRSRWGSCSSKGIINLSFYLVMLPDYLVEYVLLHELCHTVHLNHGPAFWVLLNRCTQNKAYEFRRELRKYRRF